jgi:hypothetical protein
MLGSLYDALRSANVADDKARLAAEEVALHENARLAGDVRLVKWMLGTLIALQIALGAGNLWLSFNILGRLPR